MTYTPARHQMPTKGQTADSPVTHGQGRGPVRTPLNASNRVEVESRMGVESIEALLDDRAELIKEVAELRALFGSFGTWDHRRKIELARLSGELRARVRKEGAKITEAALDEAAHADPRYEAFITDATNQRAKWTILENRIQSINDVILRDNSIARFASSEMHLR